MKRKTVFWILITSLIISGCVPSGYEVSASCNCKPITEGTGNSDYFNFLNNSYFVFHDTTDIILPSPICEYEIQNAVEKRRYSGIENTEGLLHYKTPCLSLFTEGIFQDKNQNYYLCKCQI